MKLEPGNATHVEILARDLHEAGREAVIAGGTIRGKGASDQFVEWVACPTHVQEGRRVQARWLMGRYRMLRN